MRSESSSTIVRPARGAVEETYTPRQLVVDRSLTAIALLVVTALGVVQLIPLYWMISTSIKLPEGLFSVPPQWIPYPISLNAYERLARYLWTARWFTNTLIVSSLVTIGYLLINTSAGYVLAKLQFTGRQILFWLVLATMTIPGQVVLIPQYSLMVEFNWINTYRGLILPSLGGAFGIFLMKQFLQTLPSSLVDAARVDACSEVAIFLKVVMPLAKPALAVLAIFTFIGNWNSFLWPLLVANRPDMFMLQVGLAQLRFGAFDYGMLMAGATASAVPVVLVFLALQRYFMTGLTLGAIKG